MRVALTGGFARSVPKLASEQGDCQWPFRSWPRCAFARGCRGLPRETGPVLIERTLGGVALIAPPQRILARLARGAFVRNVAKLAGGHGLAMAIPILTAPALGRLYTPSDYGLLSVFMGISTIFSMIGNWQYSQAIVVQRTERRADCLLAVSVWTSIATALASLIAAAAVTLFLGTHSSTQPVLAWFWAVPLTTFCAGVSSALAAVANRQRQYGLMSAVSVASVLATSVVAIVLGYLEAGVSGLFLSYVVGQLLAFIVYTWFFWTTLRVVGAFGAASVVALARKNSSFARFSLPASLLRSVALATPGFALAYMGSVDVAGHLSRAQSLLALPISLVGMALAQVFQEKAVWERAQTGNCWGSYKKLLTALAVGSPPAFALLALVAPHLFVVYLGDHWKDTGYVAQLLAPMMCLRMISGPLWPVFSIFNANDQDFWIALWQFLATVVLSVAIAAFAFAAVWQVVAYGVVNSIICLALIVQSYQLVHAGSQRKASVG